MDLVPAKEYTDVELIGTVRSLEPWWELLVDGFEGFDRPPSVPGSIAAARLLAAGDREVMEAVVDECLSLFTTTARALAATGAYPTSLGRVHGLFRSAGGVPKLAVDSVEIGVRGVEGDRQLAEQHHGRPWQALCLWSLETVERLAAEGHPIAPGAAGENVSIAGVDWTTIRPGMRMALGPEVMVELAPWALPCRKNARWFADRDFSRMHHDREPGVSRIYASVLRGGRLATGDEVVVEP